MSAAPGPADLRDRVVVVTGASSGIGAGIASAFAAAGARVGLVGRDAQRLEAVAARPEFEGRACLIEADLLDDGARQQVVEETLAGFGAIDALVHAAGVFEPGPFAESLPLLEKQWAINVRAPFSLTQQALPHLRPGGSVVFVSSIAGRVGFSGSTAYCATKGAIEQLTRALALEEARNGVRINAVAPGHVYTPLNQAFMREPGYEAELVEATPVGRIGTVEEIAPAALFLASDGARFITGESIVVDGGWLAQ